MAKISEALVREVVKEILAQVTNGASVQTPAAPAMSPANGEYAVADMTMREVGEARQGTSSNEGVDDSFIV